MDRRAFGYHLFSNDDDMRKVFLPNVNSVTIANKTDQEETNPLVKAPLQGPEAYAFGAEQGIYECHSNFDVATVE